MTIVIFAAVLGWMCCGRTREEIMEQQRREAEQVAIEEHARATGESVEQVLEKVTRREMIVVRGSKGLMVLYNSPNGL